MSGKLGARYDAGGHCNGTDSIQLSSADVIGMVAYQGYCSVAAKPSGAARLPEGDFYETGSGGGLFGEGSETEVGGESAVLHLAPADGGEITGNETHGDAGAVKAA